MKFIAKCQDCGEQKILEEWMRCKSCFAKWFANASNKSDYFTDDDAWYVIPQLDPAKVDEAAVAKRVKSFTSLEAARRVNIFISDHIEKMKPMAEKAWVKYLKTLNLRHNFS